MRNMILQTFAISTPEIELATDLIIGLHESRRVSSSFLAHYVSGTSNLSSKQRRIERFYSKNYVAPEYLLGAIRKMFGAKKFVLSLDRTNWEFGKSSVNAFTAFACGDGIDSLVNLKMLDNNGGNSKSEDRIDLAMEVIKSYGKENIENILGDREFFSVKFASWLTEEDLPYTLRVKENLAFVQPYLKHATSKGVMFKNVIIAKQDTGIDLCCDLSIKKLRGEYLILASRIVKNPLEKYKSRWAVERFFKMLKTGGFNLESSKITDPKRLEILFLLCSIAYLICVKMGAYRNQKVKEMRWRHKDNCYEYSYFRWGLDWIQELISKGIETLKTTLTLVFTQV
jgi:hypothetical protein